MRKYGLIAAVAALVLSLGAVAYAQAPGVTTEVLLTVRLTPNDAGTAANPKNVTLDITVGSRNSDGSQPPVVSRAKVFFDSGLVFNGGIFPACSAQELNSGGKARCQRRGSQVGTGSAKAQVGTTVVPVGVTAFDGPGTTKFELFIEASRPIRIAQTIEGTLRRPATARDRARYGNYLDVPIPEQIQQPVPGLFSSLTEFKTTIPAGITRRVPVRRAGRTTFVRKSYVQFRQCTQRRLDFKYEITKRRTTTPPSQGGTQSIEKNYPCRA
jgi:hypothetical protein